MKQPPVQLNFSKTLLILPTHRSERDSSAVADNKPQSLPLIRESLDKYELSHSAKRHTHGFVEVGHDQTIPDILEEMARILRGTQIGQI